jgi:HK97 family phage major capsid protein
MSPLSTKLAAGDDFSDDEQAEFDTLNKDVEALEKRLSNLRTAEKTLAGRSTEATGSAVSKPAVIKSAHMGSGKGRPMDMLIRQAVVSYESHVRRVPLESVIQQRYAERDDFQTYIKAVTNPAQTTVAGWAAELVNTAVDDFIEALRPVSVYGNLSAMGPRFTFGRNGSIVIPRRNKTNGAPGDLRGAFVGEGQPIPVRRAEFGSSRLSPHKMGVISTYTREMANQSTPAIEALIREGIIEDTAVAIDTALLDAVAANAIRPAGLLNTVVAITGATGGGVDAMQTDIQAALTPFITANAADRLVWLLNPATRLKMSWAATAVGVYPFRDQIAAGNIGGIPYIESTSVGATDLILVRAADFSSALGDAPEFDVSDVATIHEDDGGYAADQTATDGVTTVKPLATGTGGAGAITAAPVRSLWQTASIGVRMLLDMDWAMRRPGVVSHVSGLTW